MGLGIFFKVTLQTRAPENFRVRRWGAERRVSRAQTRERGPPSAYAEIFVYLGLSFRKRSMVILSLQTTCMKLVLSVLEMALHALHIY